MAERAAQLSWAHPERFGCGQAEEEEEDGMRTEMELLCQQLEPMDDKMEQCLADVQPLPDEPPES